MNEKKSNLKIQFNSIKENPHDPTLLEALMVVHDFEKSWNNQVISEEVCAENMSSLIDKRIVCKYIPEDENDGEAALGDHEEDLIVNNGKEVVITRTHACGFIKEVFIDDFTDKNGNTKRVLYAKAILWNDEKYKMINELLLDWLERGIQVNMSCEYLYANYEMVDGVEYIKSPILYTGHCLLNSEVRGDHDIVEGAYSDSKLLSLNDKKEWNKAINSLNKKEETMEKNNVMLEMLKSKNAINVNGYRWRIYEALAKVMMAEEYNSMYISEYDIYPEEKYFIYDAYTEENGYKLYKVTFSVEENDVISVNYDERQEVEYKCDLVPVEELKQQLNEKDEVLKSVNEKVAELNAEISEKEVKIEELTTSLNSKEEEIKNALMDKAEIENKLNETNEVVISLNSKIGELENDVAEMTPIVEAHQEEKYKIAMNAFSNEYKEKFEKVNNIEAFESDEVQELIHKSINKKDLSICEEFKKQLNQIIVDSIKTTIEIEDTVPAKKSINSIVKGKENKDLVADFIDEFEEIYGFKK